MDKFKETLNEILYQQNAFTDALAKVETKLGVQRLYIVLGLGCLICLWLMIGYGAQFVCNFIGFLYPAYASIKAIESDNKDEYSQWLTYWVVYGVFSLLEFFADIFLFWIPMYWFIKSVFLVWCMMPHTNGSHIIYNRIIRPVFLRHQHKVDEVLDHAGRVINEASGVTRDAAADIASDIVKKSL